MKHLKSAGLLCLCAMLATMTSCDNFLGIDDDLSDCGKNFNLNYHVRLITNKDVEVRSVLNSANDQYVAMAVDNVLSGYFKEYANNLDLAFYRTENGTQELNEIQPINGNQASYTFYLEHDQYTNLAIGNSEQEPAVTLSGKETLTTSRLTANGGETLQNHSIALYTGRAALDATGQKELAGDVYLYMANSAAVLVIDTTGYHVQNIRVTVEDVATAFNIADSTYAYNGSSIEARQIDMTSYPDNKREAFYAYCFPSRDKATSTDTPIWRMKVYITLNDGSTTENILNIHNPLLAGNAEIYKTKIDKKGVLLIADPSVGVSVTFNWKPGGEYNPDF